MDQKVESAMKSLECDNFLKLCLEYGIRAKTGCKWRKRFMERGAKEIEELSHKPHGHCEQLGDETGCEIIRLKHAHPHWGPAQDQKTPQAQAP